MDIVSGVNETSARVFERKPKLGTELNNTIQWNNSFTKAKGEAAVSLEFQVMPREMQIPPCNTFIANCAKQILANIPLSKIWF